ncbi:hypothetical protein Pnap_4073 [Polaromonas naphthalenivorans CJ2]|uniref:Uncharacterized protein n=1 Tax=Polaromonas naphthalenivorans (strain CJ2) TaxID=365044 RepID=A1VUN6_POLNA|nr:hypothetical protein Pnap_4073 [Polaromonas naphthalenivorans CJ2]
MIVKKPASCGFFMGCLKLGVSGRREPVAGVERTAHAQRQWRHVEQFVGRHRFCTFCDDLLGLIRPIPLANVWGAGYRKE